MKDLEHKIKETLHSIENDLAPIEVARIIAQHLIVEPMSARNIANKMIQNFEMQGGSSVCETLESQFLAILLSPAQLEIDARMAASSYEATLYPFGEELTFLAIPFEALCYDWKLRAAIHRACIQGLVNDVRGGEKIFREDKVSPDNTCLSLKRFACNGEVSAHLPRSALVALVVACYAALSFEQTPTKQHTNPREEMRLLMADVLSRLAVRLAQIESGDRDAVRKYPWLAGSEVARDVSSLREVCASTDTFMADALLAKSFEFASQHVKRMCPQSAAVPMETDEGNKNDESEGGLI